jgi:hypothetical protein
MVNIRPTDEQLRNWLDWDTPGDFPEYYEDNHYEYLEAMFKEILESREMIKELKADLQEYLKELDDAIMRSW